ncbi:hypothetical protein ACPZ19_49945 [Amycolatopsis lurida]
MSTVAAPVIDLALPHPRGDSSRGIATLGPAGTSSEQSAWFLRDYLSLGWRDRRPSAPPVSLYPRYEDAAQAVIAGESELLLVANAYHGASAFYMSAELRFAGAYLFDTPLYGIATHDGELPGGTISIASHPAPIPLIEQLLAGTGTTAWTVVQHNSTSAAARAAAEGAVAAALTTAPAAALHGLKFVTRTRTIRMLWSVFTAAERAIGNLSARGSGR